MNLKPLGANKTELIFDDGTMVLFSYETPVAMYVKDADGEMRAYHTDFKWSRTTTRHINTWFDRYAGTKPQEFFSQFVKAVS
jgi:hypothetical protein